MNRRRLMSAMAGWMSLLPAGCGAFRGRGAPERPVEPKHSLAELEAVSGGRLGVAIVGLDGPLIHGHRLDERFGMCSTFKLPLVATILREVDAGRMSLDTWVSYGEADLCAHAPVTRTKLEAGGMTIGALAEATLTTSDNPAANLLLERLHGPGGFTTKLRAMGDTVTRLDRVEPMLNLVVPGEVRDTTTPRAIAVLVHRLFTGELLREESRARLRSWAVATQTGMPRLSAGMPSRWIVGDKTGTGVASQPGIMNNKHNDVAIAWRGDLEPLVVAAYYEAPGYFVEPRAEDDAVLAQVGRMVARLDQHSM